jgi:hypothetical protein
MRTKKVSRHFCDFCAKGMFKIPSMQKHERGCTKNPNRHCLVCARIGQKQPPTENLVSMAKALSPSDEGALRRYRDFCGGCPACMLAGVRQAYPCTFEFDFKAEWDRYLQEQLDLEREAAERATY